MRTDLPASPWAFAAWPDSTSSALITTDTSNPDIRIIHPQLAKPCNKIGLNCRRPQGASMHVGSKSGCFGVLDRLPDPMRRRRHSDIEHAVAAQGIDDGTGDDGKSRREIVR